MAQPCGRARHISADLRTQAGLRHCLRARYVPPAIKTGRGWSPRRCADTLGRRLPSLTRQEWFWPGLPAIGCCPPPVEQPSPGAETRLRWMAAGDERIPSLEKHDAPVRDSSPSCCARRWRRLARVPAHRTSARECAATREGLGVPCGDVGHLRFRDDARMTGVALRLGQR